MNFDWKVLNNNIKELPDIVNNIIKQSEININKILLYDIVTEKDKFLKILEKDTIEINKIYSLLNLLSFVSNNQIINNCENTLSEYNKKLKINGNFIKKLIYFNKINNNNIELYQQKFIENILNQLKYNKLIFQDKIFIDGITFNDFNINIYNLNNILLNLKKKDRIQIIVKYNNFIYERLMDTLIMRFNESKYYMLDNYFMYKNKLSTKSLNSLKKFINDLIKTVNEQLIKKKDFYKNKNYDYDDLILIENNFNILNISLNFFIQKTFDFFQNYFNLQIQEISSNNKWNNNVNIYKLSYNNKIIGYLYLDLLKNDIGNKPKIPVYININNSHFNKLYNINEIAQSCIFASFDNSTKKIINFNMAQKLFVEFMLAIYNLFIYNNFGFSNINIENKNIIEILAEKIFQNENFITNFYNLENNILENYFEELRLIKLIKFRYLCIDSLFDMAIHTDNTINKCNHKIIFEKTYDEINKCYFIENFNYNNMNPNLLYKINGDYGSKYYHIIFNEIISHNISNLILKKKLGRELFEDLSNIKNDFITNLKIYLEKYNINNKNIKFIIKSNNKDKEKTSESESNFYKEI